MNNMKFIPVLCLVASSFVLFGQHTPVIEYAAIGPFNWSLFKGKVNPKHLNEMGKNTGAVTVSSISYSTLDITSRSATVLITARFHPEESWTRYPKLNDPDGALVHEKKHLDITEIYARKLRQQVSTTRFSAGRFQEEVKQMFRQVVSDQREEQARYDRETQHSTDPVQQEKWNTRIAAQLKALSAYADNTIKVVFK